MAAGIPGMGKAGRVYTGIYRRYGKYPVYTAIYGVTRDYAILPMLGRSYWPHTDPNPTLFLRLFK